MKYPKLKNTFACNLLLFLPILPPFIFITIAAILDNIFGISKYDFIILTAFFITGIFTLIYIFKNIYLFLQIEVLSILINNWKKDRLWFETSCNGYDRKSAEKIILKRAKHCGKIKQPVQSNVTPVFIRYKRCYSCMQTTAAKEKITLLYSVNHLDNDTYKSILNSANLCSKAVQCKKEDIKFIDKTQRKAPIVTAVAVIILADSASAEIPELTRKLTNEKQNKLIVPAVVDFSVNRYYFNPSKEPYESAFMSVPARNLARKMIIKTLFAGKIPYKNNKNLTTFEHKGIDMEMPLWTYIKKEIINTKASEKYIENIAKKLNDGDIFMDDENTIFCKIGNRTAVITTEINEDDNSVYDVLVPDIWIYPKTYQMSKSAQAMVKDKIKKYMKEKSLNYKII